MPCESSSQTLNNTNSLYPVRDTVVIKGDGANKNIFIVPEYNTLKDKYELAWDVGYEHMIDCYAIVQKWTDQGISADYYEDFTSPWQEPLTDKVVLKRYLKKVKMGLKSTYYTNSKTRKNSEANNTQDIGCASGGCSL
jgi:ribonucleoside-diphosphate reductase alpha chain